MTEVKKPTFTRLPDGDQWEMEDSTPYRIVLGYLCPCGASATIDAYYETHCRFCDRRVRIRPVVEVEDR